MEKNLLLTQEEHILPFNRVSWDRWGYCLVEAIQGARLTSGKFWQGEKLPGSPILRSPQHSPAQGQEMKMHSSQPAQLFRSGD